MKVGDIVQCPFYEGIGPVRWIGRIEREGFLMIEVQIKVGRFLGYTRCYYPNEAKVGELIPLPFLEKPMDLLKQ